MNRNMSHHNNENNLSLTTSDSDNFDENNKLLDKLFQSATSEQSVKKSVATDMLSATSVNSINENNYLFSATSDNSEQNQIESSKQNMTDKENINSTLFKMYGGENLETMSIEIPNSDKLKSLFSGEQQLRYNKTTSQSIPKNISDLINQIQSLTETEHVNTNSYTEANNKKLISEFNNSNFSQTEIKDSSFPMNKGNTKKYATTNNSNQMTTDITGGGGNPEIFKENVRLSKYISSKSGISYRDSLKVTKYYRDKVKDAGNITDVVAQYKEAYKNYDKDLSSGNASSVINKIVKNNQKREPKNQKREKVKNQKRETQKHHQKRQNKEEKEETVETVNVETDTDQDTSELSYVSTTSD